MRKTLAFILTLIFLAAVHPSAMAVDVQGDLVVEVKTAEKEAPVAGATVKVQDRNQARPPVEMKTDEGGVARFTNLLQGEYLVEVAQPDYEPDRGIVTVTGGASAKFQTYLDVKGGEKVIKVKGERLLMNARDPNTSSEPRNSRFMEEQIANPCSLQAVVSTVPGVQTNSQGQLHVRGEHKAITYSIDGINVPIPVEQSASQLIDPRFLEQLDVKTGLYDASYGGQLGAVLNMVTRSGALTPYTDLIVRGGSYGTLDALLRSAGTSDDGRFSYFVGARTGRTDLRQEAPQPTSQTLNNDGADTNLLTRLTWTTDDDQVGLTYAYQNSAFGIAQNSTNYASGVRQNQIDRNALVVASWKRKVSENDDLQLGVAYFQSRQMVRNNGVFTNFTAFAGEPEEVAPACPPACPPVPAVAPIAAVEIPEAQLELAEEGFPVCASQPGSPYLPTSDLSITQWQPSFEYTHRMGEDSRIKVGGTANFIQSRQTVSIIDAGGGGGLPNPNPCLPAPTVFDANVDRPGFLGGIYFSHTLPVGKDLVLNYGVRGDTFRNGADLSTGQISPLVNLAWAISDKQALRFSFNRLFQVPPLEIDISGSANVLPQRTSMFELNYQIQPAKDVVANAALVAKYYRDQVDVGLLLPNSNIPVFAPTNFALAYYKGAELSVTTSHKEGFNGFLSTTIGEARPLRPGAPGGELPQYNDHDQRVQITGGLSYTWKSGFNAAVDFLYGSGYPQEALPLYNELGLAPFGLSGSRIPRFVTNLNLTYNHPDATSRHKPLLGWGIQVQNLFDQRKVLNFLSEFTGTRFVPGRRVLLQASLKF